MRTLVTGGGGFVGRYVVEQLLSRGYAVRSLGRRPQADLAELGADVLCGDLRDSEAVKSACEGVDAVIHVAAKAGVWGSWDDYFGPNVIGTRNVVAGCRAQGVRYLVYTSTPSVVFNRKPIINGDETMPYGSNWLCHYAATKAMAEAEVLSANGLDLKVLALRPHLIFGPGDPHLLPRVIESALCGRLKIVGGGVNRVDVSYVEDVATAHLNALDVLVNGDKGGRAFFISQGEPVLLWPWVNSILEGLGHTPIVKRVPLPLAYGVGTVCEYIWRLARRQDDPPMTRFVAVELAKDHFFSIQAAYSELGYKPSVSMEAALDATIADLSARGFGAED
jgi:nucleoside-diphosphate-sugar epimerase